MDFVWVYEEEEETTTGFEKMKVVVSVDVFEAGAFGWCL